MRILITGSTGQVGWELARSLAPLGELILPTRAEFDLSEPQQLDQRIAALAPDLIVNPAAYTAVDRAESEPERAFLVNRDGPEALARSCARRGIRLIHFSTDYVYPGSGTAPWREDDAVAPVNVYGRSKLEGEQAIHACGCQALIFRTCWVYSARGANFLLTMLRLADSGKPLSIVADQWGAPTSARLIGQTVAAVVARTATVTGTFHLAAAGVTSWHGFATEIFRLRTVMTDKPMPQIAAIDSAAFKSAAPRPTNSRLDLSQLQASFGLRMPDWRQALAQVMQDAPTPLAAYLGTLA